MGTSYRLHLRPDLHRSPFGTGMQERHFTLHIKGEIRGLVLRALPGSDMYGDREWRGQRAASRHVMREDLEGDAFICSKAWRQGRGCVDRLPG